MLTRKNSKIAATFIRGSFHVMRFIERGAGPNSRPGIDELGRLRRFLFFEYGTALGSNVHATPIYEALKRAVPDAVAMVACGRMAFEVFRNNPFIDYLVETSRPPVNVLDAIRSLRECLKTEHFAPEIVITSMGNEQRSIALLSVFAGGAIRFGYTLAPELYDVPLRPDRERSLIENQLSIIERLGYKKQFVEPRVSFSREDLVQAQSLVEASGAADGGPRVVFITQTSPTQRKSWPREDSCRWRTTLQMSIAPAPSLWEPIRKRRTSNRSAAKCRATASRWLVRRPFRN